MSLTTQIERSHQLACSATIEQHSHMITEPEKGLSGLGGRLGEKLRSRPRVSYLDSVDIEHPVDVDRIANPKWKRDQLCWEAKGKCFEDYKHMEAGLLRELNQSRQESFCEVSVSLFMIGKTPESAKPIIIISSEDQRSREAARKAILTSGILKHANFELGVLKYLPSGPIHPVASSRHSYSSGDPLSSTHGESEGQISNDSQYVTTSLPYLPNATVRLSAYYDPRHQVRTTGMPIFVKTSVNQSRRATANIVYNGSEYGCITAAHVFSPWDHDSRSVDWGEEDIGIPFDNDSDDEDDRNGEVSSESSPILISVKSTGSQGPDDKNALMHKPMKRTLPCDFESPPDLALLGHTTAVEDFEKSIDCAIITIDNPELCKKLENLTISKREQTIQIASAQSKSPVTAWTTHGPIQGVLNDVPILMCIPGGGYFHPVYAFSYEGSIENGDCGSLVVGSVSKELYGMVVAASDKQRIAYIVGANWILDYISEKGWRLLQVDGNHTASIERHDKVILNDSQPKPTSNITVTDPKHPEWSNEHQRYLQRVWDSYSRRFYRTHHIDGQGWVFFDWLPAGLRYLSSTGGSEIQSIHNYNMIEQLDSSYYTRNQSFFTIGRVFSMLFSEIGDHATKDDDRADSVLQYGKLVPTYIRRFIVVRRRHGFCYAIPIFTYRGKAATTYGVSPDDYAVAYSMGNEPQLVPGEQAPSMRPIQVMMSEGVPPLPAESRINFGIHYPVQHNVRVKDLGTVHPESIPDLLRYWNYSAGN